MFQSYLRLIALLLLIAPVAAPAWASENPTYVATLKAGLEKMRDGDWDGALVAAGGPGTVRRDIIEWHRLRAGKGSFQDALAFLARRGDWPGLKLLRKRCEPSIPADANPAQVRAFFSAQPPQTGHGALRLAQAWLASGEAGQAQAVAKRAWETLPMEAEEEEALLAAFPRALRAAHWQRTDMLLWSGEGKAAARLLPQLDKGHQALARARIALRARKDGVNALINAIPPALAGDPGLAYERFVWRAREGLNDSAIALALERSNSAESLGQPERWGRRRAELARWAMREGKARLAYRLAASHHIASGSYQADLEWLAGYIALRKLGDPQRAIWHFGNMHDDVFSPISLGRVGYWLGRAYEAAGEAEPARAAYLRAARFQTAFYGQLAAEKMGVPMTPELAGARRYSGWEQARFWHDSNMVAARLLEAADELYLALRFSGHLSERLTDEERGQLLAWAEAVDAPYLEVKLAKYVLRMGTLLERPFFALPDLGVSDRRVPTEFLLAIARRESEFNPRVVSGAGARGLMQLMPGTARDMAAELGIGYSKERLLDDPSYNAKLGLAYLGHLYETYGPNPILVAVGYNAGPGRARSWRAAMGHPGDPGVDPIDWIEHIPFHETRNYAMRVAESLAIYRARLKGAPVAFTLSKDLRRK